MKSTINNKLKDNIQQMKANLKGLNYKRTLSVQGINV